MKQSIAAKKVESKGTRLNWTPLKEVNHVPLIKDSIKGKQVASKDLSAKRKVLVP